MLCGHGNDKYNAGCKIVADFSTNVWHQYLPQRFYDDLSLCLKKTVDYPHPHASDFKKQLAKFHNLAENNIWVTNGSVEGIYLLAQAFEKTKSAIIYPAFSEYEDACIRYNHSLRFYSNSEKWNERKFLENFVWFGNPNNPDGKTIEFGALENMLEANPSTTFIVDEAFAELCIGFQSSISLLNKFENLIVLCSFTKTFSIPGIRLGCVFGQEKVINKLEQLSIPWSVNTIAAEAGKIILANYKRYLPEQNNLKEMNTYMQRQLNKIEGITIGKSQCNFFLLRLKKGSGANLKNFLLAEYGILIRDASNFRGLDIRCIRVSVQAKEKVDVLVTALKNYFNECD